MATWLDRFALDAGHEVAVDLVAKGQGHLPHAKNPLLAMMATANRAAVIRAQSRSGVDINTEFDATIARWFLDQSGHCDRHVAAFQFDRETIEGLVKLQVTREMAEKAEMFNAQYLAVYLDFADQALMAAGKFEVSAIALLTQRSPDGQYLAAPRAGNRRPRTSARAHRERGRTAYRGGSPPTIAACGPSMRAVKTKPTAGQARSASVCAGTSGSHARCARKFPTRSRQTLRRCSSAVRPWGRVSKLRGVCRIVRGRQTSADRARRR